MFGRPPGAVSLLHQSASIHCGSGVSAALKLADQTCKHLVSVRTMVRKRFCFRGHYSEETCYLDPGLSRSGRNKKGPWLRALPKCEADQKTPEAPV